MSSRYYFNLTDGTKFIRDEEGIQLADIPTAVIYAITAIEQLVHEVSQLSNQWLRWKLEIINDNGEVVSVIPFANLSSQEGFLH